MTSPDPPPTRTIKLTLAYDGTDFAGWQIQPSRPTVQEALEVAIETITGRRVSVMASGRTDAGVHALGQVASFRTESPLSPETLRRALNAELPRSVAVLDAADVPADFHATRSAVRKQYRYLIHDGPIRDVLRLRYCWQYTYGRLDAAAMQRAAEALVGTHDFSSFETSGAPRRSSVRTVFRLDVQRGRGDQQDLVIVEIEANGFLYNMVRAIVGTLAEVGYGNQPETWPAEVLAARNRRVAGRTAPPQGLYLVKVQYREDDPPCESPTS